jgi:serine/threonine protein phosphatase PrpC
MFAVKSIKGEREYMEDRYAVIQRHSPIPVIIGMVCDGHSGKKTADLLSANLPFLLLNALHAHPPAGVQQKTSSSDLKMANAIHRIILDYCNTLKTQRSGSTLTGFLATQTTVFIFNIGDSRTCIHFKKNGGTVNYLGETAEFMSKTQAKSPHRLTSTPSQATTTPTPSLPARALRSETMYWNTIDHTFQNPTELERIHREGGFVRDERLNGMLAMSRSVGDFDTGKGLSCVPSVYWVSKNSICDVILMYSDGAYEEVKEVPHQLYHIAVENGADALVDHATKSGSQDNITALLVGI